MTQKRILLPTLGHDDWKNHLAQPDAHWKPGKSAMCAAIAWEQAKGLPRDVGELFTQSGIEDFRDLSLALAIPEYKVALDGGNACSQNDLFCVLTSASGLTCMTVEAKAGEDFDVTMEEWQKRTSESGAAIRLGHIMSKIGLSLPIPPNVRYQLLHRMASAVIESERFHAKNAVMLVQSFPTSTNTCNDHFDDFQNFVSLYNKEASKNQLLRLASVGHIAVYAAWIDSR